MNFKIDNDITHTDPRPDLGEGEEHLAWGMLLAHAWGVDKELYGLLHGFRSQGTRLISYDSGCKLEPEIGANGWSSLQDYKQARNKYLMPKKNKLIEILKKI